ncbi:flagellar biosynthesis protein FlhB [Nitrincola alkalilacustris]|uniref:flagellar biosynthesis protein FlhB n=1 Tax=Nitrincola alkalilacustris TaxID=1571224 RepID=UPI00124D5F93|nr:flagellar biosynthesis protein FlhB [Nitrincola alkalilacustris]
MAEESGQEKSQEPTSKRIQDARNKGDIPRSRELNTFTLLMAAAFSAILFGSMLASALMEMMKYNFSLRGDEIWDVSYMVKHLFESLYMSFFSLWGFFLLVFMVTLLTPMFMGGWNFSTDALQPKGSRLDPIAGIKRMFSGNSLVELFKAIGKVLIVGSVAVIVLFAARHELVSLTSEAVEPATVHAVEILKWIFLALAASILIIVLIDVPWQHYSYNKKLKMTMQEVKDEHKNTEGKPEVKRRIRQLQFEVSQRKMMSEVPTADVVITNPTHYAVAIRYDQSSSDAPIVIAKGADFVALKIREIAKEHDVPILSSPALARALFYATEINEEVPSGLYTAVAQVLAYVFQMRTFKIGTGKQPVPPREAELKIPDNMRVDEE